MERRQWLAVYGRVIDDVRAALDWAFSPDGDAAIGVALTAWSLPLGYQLSLIDELRVWVERALLHAGLISPAQPLLEMRLNIAMIRLSQNLTVPVPGPAPGFDRAVELSRQLDDLAQQAEPLIGHVTYCLGAADYAAAVELSDRARAIAEAAGSAEAMLGVDRVAAQAHHFNGDHTTARRLARRVWSIRLRVSRSPTIRRRSPGTWRCEACLPASPGCRARQRKPRPSPARQSNWPPATFSASLRRPSSMSVRAAG
jgi:hypothetical protein